MDRQAWLTLLALVVIALLAGGAAVGLTALTGDPSAVVALAFVTVVIAGVFGVASSRRQSWTPYW